jgi:murein L,D-transpeptidase YcbB/YkuD
MFISANDINVVNEHIRKRVEDLVAGNKSSIQGEILYCEKIIPEFYSHHNYEPAWKNDRNKKELIRLLGQASEEGLRSDDYHYGTILSLSDYARGAEQVAEMDMLLTDAYFLYASHILNGKVNPETIDSEWKATRREGNPVQLLDTALSVKEIYQSIIDLKPLHPSYQGLKEALKMYEMIAGNGGWSKIPVGETLKVGMKDSLRVPLIIERLMSTKDLQIAPGDGYTYSDTIASSVKNYQLRNGLDVDGNLGKMTTESMNITAEKRIEQIKVNMERFRWISHDLGEQYIFVNIADFQLRVYEDNKIVLKEKVIVGRPYRKTPVFTSQMMYIVLNPYWTVPPTILYEDMIPEVTKNADYLSSKKIRVFQGNGSNMIEINPDSISWSDMSRNNFTYTLKQDPGSLNALGEVKFMFPNKYNVYIHDTPSKELFNRSERTFSSGCIRLNNPRSLIQYLIPEYLDSDIEKIEKIIDKGKEHTILLTHPINVHILYLTAWVENGIVQFRKDIYERDAGVLTALNESPTGVY